MAPMGTPGYLPPLGRCLAGYEHILSWRDAYTALRSACINNSAPLPDFFRDDDVRNLLQTPFEPTKAPSPTSKAKFETLTSAINVTPVDNAPYNITEIKEDALWLSKAARVDEVVALRIVVLEWQSRPIAQLLKNSVNGGCEDIPNGPSADHDAASVSKNKSLEASTPAHKGSSRHAQASQQRRRRIMQLVVSEDLNRLRCSELLVRYALRAKSSSGKATGRVDIIELGNIIINKLCPHGRCDSAVKETVNALQHRVTMLELDIASIVSESDSDLEELWAEAHMNAMIVTWQLILGLLGNTDQVLHSESVLAFFRCLAKYGFFNDLQPQSPRHGVLIQQLQALSAVVCIAVLNPGNLEDCIDLNLTRYLESTSNPRAACYINDPFLVSEVTGIFTALVEANATLPAPAMFLWAYALQIVKDIAEQSALAGDSQYSPKSGQSASISVYRQAFESIYDKPDTKDPAVELASYAVDGCQMFQLMSEIIWTAQRTFNSTLDGYIEQLVRRQFLQVVKVARHMVRYGSELFSSLLAILAGDRPYWDSVPHPEVDPVVQEFMADEELRGGFLYEAQSRYPLEAAPYLKLMRTILIHSSADTSAVDRCVRILEDSPVFTQRLPLHFSSYRLLDEEPSGIDDMALVELTADLPLFASRKPALPALPPPGQRNELVLLPDNSEDNVGLIPSRTIGMVNADDTIPKVVSWNFRYSPLQYIIRCLSTALAGNDQVDVASNASLSTDEISDIIGLLATVLTTSRQTGVAENGDSVYMRVIDEIPQQLVPGKDLTQIVFEIFEARLEQAQQSSTPDEFLELLIACIRFFYAVALKLPSRVWPFLVRSQLIGLNGDEPSLVHIVNAVEMVSGRYEFLLSCIKLFDVLVEASLDNVIPLHQTSKALTRFNTNAINNTLTGSSPAKMKGQVLIGFLRPFVSVFENCRNWRFDPSVNDRFHIKTWIASIMTKILKLTYGVGDEPNLSDKVTGLLADSAEYLANYLLSTSSSRNLVEPILDMLFSPLSNTLLLNSMSVDLVEQQATEAVSLATTTLRLGVYLERLTSVLETQLFANAGMLAQLFASTSPLRLPLAHLFDALITSAARSETPPPSLLGHMSKGTAKSFLAVLTLLMKPALDMEVELGVWNLLSSVVSSRQQWFAVYLLTGTSPKERSTKANGVRTDENTRVDGKSLFGYALNLLSNPSELSYPRAISLLKFVSRCLNHWPWAMSELRREEFRVEKDKHGDKKSFINGITDYIMKLKRIDSQTPEQTLYTDATIASYIAEILAMYIHSSRQIGEKKTINSLPSKLAYLRNFGVANPSYNVSLHQGLRKNMKDAYPDLELTSLKHTLLLPPEYGVNYFYDVELATKILKMGHKVQNENSTLKELELANVNLSTVDSQVSLLKKWSLLAVELSNTLFALTKEEALPVAALLVDVVRHCLELEKAGDADAKRTPPEAVLEKLRELRLNLALALLQKLVEAASYRLPEVDDSLKSLFNAAWWAARGLQTNSEASFVGTSAKLFRTALQILFLTFEPLRRLRNKVTTENLRMSVMAVSRGAGKGQELEALECENGLQEVVAQVVAGGFRNLCAILHEDPSAVEPSDFVLITGILQAILNIPGVEMLHSKFALIFSNCNLIRCGISLFSWADQLRREDGDPVYGELAILFLLSLSSIPTFAESMAVEGILSQLSSANIMLYFARVSGMGPFDNPSRMHSIWSRGILPLCLNLLDAVGAPVAPEVVSFLNRYPKQLERLVRTLANRSDTVSTRSQHGHITLSIASETHSLALINLIVERYRAAGASAGISIDELPELDWDKQAVKEDVEDWVTGRSSLKDRIMPANERDMELAKQKPIGKDPLVTNRLEERVFEEFAAALECLNGSNGL